MKYVINFSLVMLAIFLAALAVAGMALAMQELRKLGPKPAAVHSCDAQAGKVIYAHRRKQARCMVQV